MDYLEIIRAESARFSQLAHRLPLDAPVPSCPGWTGADLIHHLAEVHDLWARIARGADGEDVSPLPRPDDASTLPDLFDAASARLVAALQDADPHQECWSWHDHGHHVGWVLRRQAHEAVIHRVDAELTTGVAVTAAPDDVAADGVDEVLTVMVDGVPDWGTFRPDASAVRLEVDDGEQSGRSWTLELGRFSGVGPESGTAYDLPTAVLTDDPAVDDVAVRVPAPAWVLDRWLWGRGPAPAVDHLDDAGRAVVERFRATVLEATQ